MKQIVCFHLFNDYSGSPKVLKMVLEGLLKDGWEVDLVSSKGGVLDELLHYKNLCKHSYPYHFSRNHSVTMMRYLVVQCYTFLLAFRWLFHKDVVFYINTLLPAAPALAGRIMGKRVIYHYHENAGVKGFFYQVLAAVMQRMAHKIICVSRYQASLLQRKKGIIVIPNILPESFREKLKPMPVMAFRRKRVLMLGSLKLYKSPLEFIQLAGRLPQYSFELVINDTQENIDSFLKKHQVDIGGNLTIYHKQKDVSTFYNKASIVLNLSDKSSFIETFGLTALEAMSAGLPVIVPTEGGIAEIVEDGINGYKMDVQDLEAIGRQIEAIFSDESLYARLSEGAYQCSLKILESDTTVKIKNVLTL